MSTVTLGADVMQWNVFEASYESAKAYTNAFTDVEVDVVFKQAEKQWKVPAFWAYGKGHDSLLGLVAGMLVMALSLLLMK